jgi:hypothetical protein
MDGLTQAFAEEIAALHDSGLAGDALKEAALEALDRYTGEVAGEVEVPGDLSSLES